MKPLHSPDHMKNYSQNDEQQHILKALEGTQPGSFLDIGAHDGISLSNTRALVERGWPGTMIEPGLDAFQELLRNYAEWPSIALIHAALVTSRQGLTPFFNNPTFYSTTEPSNMEKWASGQQFSRVFFVPTITYDDLAPWMAGVEMVSIDTEGTSVDLLHAFPIDRYRPTVFCVEHDSRMQECKEWARKHGYLVATCNAENVVMVRPLG